MIRGVTCESSTDWLESLMGTSIKAATSGTCGLTAAPTSQLEKESIPSTISAVTSGTSGSDVASTERLGDPASSSAGKAVLVSVWGLSHSCLSDPILQGSSATGVVLHKLIVQFWRREVCDTWRVHLMLQAWWCSCGIVNYDKNIRSANI